MLYYIYILYIYILVSQLNKNMQTSTCTRMYLYMYIRFLCTYLFIYIHNWAANLWVYQNHISVPSQPINQSDLINISMKPIYMAVELHSFTCNHTSVQGPFKSITIYTFHISTCLNLSGNKAHSVLHMHTHIHNIYIYRLIWFIIYIYTYI